MGKNWDIDFLSDSLLDNINTNLIKPYANLTPRCTIAEIYWFLIPYSIHRIMTDPKPPAKKQYPKLYEKTIPIVLGILALVILAMLIYTVGVALGLFAVYPGL